MPVVFAPPDPIGVGIQSGYGATQQWDKTFPILASYYSDQNRQAMAQQEMAMRAAASHGGGGGGGGGSGLDNEWRMEMADRQNASAERQTLARLERDAESQRYDAAIKDRMMGHQDELRMQQMQAGLAQLEQDVQNGYLSTEEAADAAYTLRTGVDRVRQRVEAQHADEYKAHAEQRKKMVAMEDESAANTQKFMLDAAKMGHTMTTFTDPTTGRRHLIAMDPKTGRIYNPLLEHLKAGDSPNSQPAGEWSHLMTKYGSPDMVKIAKDAEAYAETMFPVKMETKTVDGMAVKVDVNFDARSDVKRRRVEGIVSEIHGGNKPQPDQKTSGEAASQPSTPPVSFGHDDLTNMNRKVIQSDKYTVQQKQQYSNALMALQSLRIQYPNMEGATEEVKAEARRLALQIAAIPQ